MSEEITAGITAQNQEPGTEPEKTFTQEEVDKIIAARLAREKKGMPSDDELQKFRTWQADQQSAQEKLGSITKERDDAAKELEAARHENLLLRLGVSADDVEYYAFKIGKLVTEKKDFETAAKEFLKEREQTKKKSAVTIDTGARLSGGGNQKQTANDIMNRLIRGNN